MLLVSLSKAMPGMSTRHMCQNSEMKPATDMISNCECSNDEALELLFYPCRRPPHSEQQQSLTQNAASTYMTWPYKDMYEFSPILH